MVTATGIFHFWEAIGINLLIFLTVLSQNLIFYDNNSVIYIVKWMVQCIFNMIEDYKQYNDEIESFNKLIMIEQKNDELNQFVNRLLPKHVIVAITFRCSIVSRILVKENFIKM